ncbi:MAG: glycosyltransferase [Thiohalorhabdus sp.]|uniref:glycosyltransferase n=1 Tax=Thiohalorhabdus sp. TaxID=3094134 RepID=UPI00397FE336
MESALFWLAAGGAAIWIGVLVLPGRPWSTRERLDPAPGTGAADLRDVTAVIPARDEAACIGRTVRALARQGRGLRILVVDDGSTDGTAAEARAAGGEGVTVLHGEPLPAGWQGKVWALEQGLRRVATPYVLFLDGDIELAPGTLAALRDKLRAEGRSLVSLMAALRMETAWERLLLPAFVFFFKLLYPFARINRPDRRASGAAGGCVLLEAQALERAGGPAAIRDAVIDDCALARRIKRAGGSVWLGLTRSARSLRAYRSLGEIHGMVARTAFTQLRYSAALLAAATALMVLAFWGPLLGLAAGGLSGRLAGGLGLAAMAAAYAPTLRFYGLSALRGLALPLAGTLFLAMTWSSAWRYWRGVRTRWKGRTYAREGPA